MRWGARAWATTMIVAVVAAGGVAAALRDAGPERAASFITDSQGRSLVQHGFSTAGSAKSAPDGLPDFSEADLDAEHADMGTNFVRFLISWRMVEPSPGVYDDGYLDDVAERVSWYADRGYHVMLDMHQDLWSMAITPDGAHGNGAPAWATYMDGLPVNDHDMWELYYLEPGVIRAFDNFWNTTGEHPELQQHYAHAWQKVASRFADEDAVVAYDLMNEPYGGTLQGARFEAGPLTELYQSTVNAIREVDADTWACLEPQAMGFNWGLPSGLGFVEDSRDGGPRIAFCPHLYPLPMDLGDGYSGSSKTLVDGTISMWTANTLRTAEALGDVPIILGEFGLDTTLPGALDYVDAVYDMASSTGMGVAYWSRDDGSWGPYDEDGTARNLVSVLDRPYPRAVAGEIVEWTSGDGELTLEFVPDAEAEASTEISLPPDAFPDGPVVDGAEIEAWLPSDGILTIVPGSDAGPGSITVTITAA